MHSDRDWIAGAGLFLVSLAAGSLAGSNVPARASAESALQDKDEHAGTEPADTTLCCADGPCEEMSVGECRARYQPKPPVARTDALRLKTPRSPILATLDRPLDRDSTLGDRMAWYFDHPAVRFVVRGRVERAEAYVPDGGRLGDMRTRCLLEVTAAHKGAPPPQLVFDTFGGELPDGSRAASSAHTSCRAGDDVLVFLWQSPTGLVAAGGARLYVRFEASDSASAWSRRVESFVRASLQQGRKR